MTENFSEESAEYLSLWREAGVDLPHADGLRRRLEGWLAAGPAPEAQAPGAAPRTLEQLSADLADCRRCKLCDGRRTVVFGDGPARARILFVGEGPGEEEDLRGLPFVGKAGQLLTKIVEAMGLARDRDVYIANVVKCRPPNNRTPEPDEVEQCLPFLREQISLVRPEIVVALGGAAASALLGSSVRITAARGRFHPLSWDEKIGVMPTFHPAYLLRNPEAKREVWEDMKKVLARLGTGGTA